MSSVTPFDGCFVRGCAQQPGIGTCGFCEAHWARVPQAVRDRLIATFRRDIPGQEYYDALRDAREEASRATPEH